MQKPTVSGIDVILAVLAAVCIGSYFQSWLLTFGTFLGLLALIPSRPN